MRYSSLFDHIMQLLNSVFRLVIDESRADYSVINTNIKVKRTEIPKSTKSIRKIVYEIPRLEIRLYIDMHIEMLNYGGLDYL